MWLVILALFVKMIAAEGNDCGVIPIVQWAGEESQRTETLPSPVGLVVVQHTVYAPCATDEECDKVVRGIRAFQMKKGFTDIGQSFLVGGNGQVYEGAGWRIGAHTLGYNNHSISMSFIGDFRESLPTPAALQAAKQFLSCAADSQLLTKEYHLVGHQQLSKTQSPGAALQKEIQTWPHWQENIAELR